MALSEIKVKLAAALETYRAATEANAERLAGLHDLGQVVRGLQAELSAAICAGATVHCGTMIEVIDETDGPVKVPCESTLHGIEQPAGKGGRVEYEIGCRDCGARVRGGLLPRHAAEAWNAGVRS